MKVAVVGAKQCKKEQVLEAIKLSGFKATKFIVAENGEIDDIVSEYAMSKKLEVDRHSIKWNDMSVENVAVATNSWGKEYNKNAPANRTTEIIDSCDAMIIINDNEIEAKQSLKKVESTDKPVYVHSLIRKSFGGMATNAEGYIHNF